jgi:hypothetical protein
MRLCVIRIAVAICAFTVGLAAASFVRIYDQHEELQVTALSPVCGELMSPAPAGEFHSASLPTPTYCELVKNADCYDGHIIRITAKLDFTDEGMYFYDDACAGGEDRTVGLITGIDYKDFDRIICKAGEDCYGPLDVVVVGRFEKVIPSGKSNLLSDIHPLHLRIMSVEKVAKGR